LPDDLAAAKQRVLTDVFGFDGFRRGQESVVDRLLRGRSILTVMPTGSGKSLCFQVPALVLGGLTVVVSPLVALMQDQVAALQLAGVAAGAINSARSRADNVETWRRAAAGTLRLLYMAPERLMTERMLAALRKLPVRLLVVDEAHCISQWGPAFRPEYQDLSRLKEIFPDVPIAALTATADRVTRQDVMERLFNAAGDCLVLGFDRPNIRLSVTPKQNPSAQLLHFMAEHRGENGIVYCLSRKKTESTAALLNEHGIKALPYHAGMEKDARDSNQNTFMTEPGTVMVATIAFGMGIDKSDVRFIFHADLPGSIEAYYQEIGRAGRDGAAAQAHMLFGLDDIRLRRLFIEDEGAGDDRKWREHKRLDALIGYCESPSCRRQALLAYFGETIDPCGNCDLCQEPVSLRDGTEEAKKLLSAVYRTGQRFGAAHIVDVVRGADTEKVRKAGHDKLTAFGCGKALSRKDWQSLTRQLVAAGFLHLDIQGYGGLIITEKGQGLLRDECSFSYRQDALTGRKAAGKKPSAQAGKAAVDLDAEAAALLDDLKALRLRLAKARNVPAYVIFPDKTLIDMARRAPADRDAFAEVSGVGQAKLRDFADSFLEVIAKADTDNAQP